MVKTSKFKTRMNWNINCSFIIVGYLIYFKFLEGWQFFAKYEVNPILIKQLFQSLLIWNHLFIYAILVRKKGTAGK